MATCLDYAKIASASYNPSTSQYYAEPPGHMVDDWNVKKFETGSLLGNGFQGGIWYNDTDVVVGCCGTNPGQAGKFAQDLVADAKIGLHILPNQSSSARNLVTLAKQMANGRRISATGHSLGGGLAQVIACWEGIPFVSFNAPAMRATMKMSKVNILQPTKMLRTWRGQKIDDTPGINFRINGDFVSSGLLGNHVGTIVQLTNPKALHKSSNHAQSNCWQAVLETDWAFLDPFEAL